MDTEYKKSGPRMVSSTRPIQSRYLHSVGRRPPAKSNESRFLQPKSRVEKAKTSTPEKEETPSLSAIDLSGISMASEKLPNGKKVKGLQNGRDKNLSTILEKNKDAAVQNELQRLCDEYLQTLYVSAASRRERQKEKTKIEHCLVNLQGRLMNRQFELHNLQKKLQTLSVNSEIELLRAKDVPDYGKILDQVTVDNCEEYIDRINEQLEGCHNRLLLRNIETPQSTGSQLQRSIDETLEALNKLQEHCDSEEHKTKIKSVELEEACNDGLKRCAEKLCQVENLEYVNYSLKIDSHKVDSIPNPFLS